MDETERALERAAAAGDPEAEARLQALRARRGEDPVTRPHRGAWFDHPDDCWCFAGETPSGERRYCVRDSFAWTCCGACKHESDCSAPRMHPTFPDHPRYREARAGSTFLSNAELRALDPDAFA